MPDSVSRRSVVLTPKVCSRHGSGDCSPVRRPQRACRLVAARDRRRHRRRRLARARPRRRTRGAALRGQQGVRTPRPGPLRRRRGGADPAGLRRRVPAEGRRSVARARRRRGAQRRRRRDRDLHRHDAHPVARPDRHAPRLRGVRRHGRAGDGGDRRVAPEEVRPDGRRSPPPCRARRDRRHLRRDRRLRAAPPGRARRVQGRDRRAQGAGAALEERGLRRRRGMDRTRVVSSEDWEPGEWNPPAEPERDYDPIHPGTNWRKRLERIFGPLVAAAIALAKFSFVLVKFSSIFIAVAAYALIWGWKFGVGVVLLILIHETGHYIEARREGLHPKLPVFIPFLGAYVQYTRGHPWQTVRVAIAGPILGGAAAFAFYLVAKSQSSDLLYALAYFGFFLNLFNLIPFGFFDGGAVWRSARFLRLGGGRGLALASYALYFATALMLILGMIASHVPQHRL